MKKLNLISYKTKNSTLIKYFLSYFFVATILFLGFFLSVRLQLKKIYSEELMIQTEKRLNNINEDFTNNINNLNLIQSLLLRNMDLILTRYVNDDWYRFQTASKLTEYTVSNSFLDSICYIDFTNNSILSSGKHVREKDNSYEIYTGNHYIEFPLENYWDARKNQLIFLEDEMSNMLIYLPYNNGIHTYTIFYIINMKELNRILENAIAPGVTAVGLFNQEEQMVAGIHSEEILPEKSLYSSRKLIGNYSIAALLSNEAILSQVNIAFRNTYILLLILATFAILLILLAMRITYWPLHKLTHKLIPSPNQEQGYVEQLDTAFTNVHSENKHLLEKISSYRLSMQKSILDSIVTDKNKAVFNADIDIEPFFTMEQDNHIFVIRAYCSRTKTDVIRDIKQYLDRSLPGDNSCILLESDKNSSVFMVHYAGIEHNKEEVLHLLMYDYYKETECRSAISNSSVSPLDIPSLYENAMTASKFFDKFPVISYHEIASFVTDENQFNYPYHQLEKLGDSLKSQLFRVAEKQLEEIFVLLNKSLGNDTPFPDFFIRCILIDVLSILINYMNRFNIKFKTYNDLYFETLYLCRSCSYVEKKEEIKGNVLKLLDIYETEYASSAINVTQIQLILEEHYTSPDFSISTLADNFQVSIAYMSYLFKKLFRENFSDYLWALRMDKAKDLLRSTNMTIDQISESVGYLNTSSFRRKFKSETGCTPSYFREHENSAP